MVPSPHLWIFHAKQWHLDTNNKSLWVPDITCRFVHEKQRDLHQNDKSILVPALICGFVHSKQRPLDQIACVIGSQTSPVIFCMQTACLASNLLVSMGPRPYLCFCACKTATL